MAAVVDFRVLPAPIRSGRDGRCSPPRAVAVSEAGGLGTIGGARGRIADELVAARKLTGRPIAVNLVVAVLRPGDAQAAADADVIVTFWGEPRRLAGGTWVHQCGSVQEARAAEAAGADAVIAQGVEAGGHVRGTTSLLALIESVCAAVKVPVLAAGGIVDQAGVREVLDAGAAAVVLGTRFLLSEESRAHHDYKLRCLQADRTILTELFGLGWAEAPHWVVPNAATRRWLGKDPRGPGWIRFVNRRASPLVLRAPEGLQDRGLAIQRPALPFLSPPMALDDGPVSLVDSGPLSAGANVTRISDICPAALTVNDLTP